MAAGTIVRRNASVEEFPGDQQGTSKDDTGSVYYWWHTLNVEWVHECNPSLELDDSTITEVTGWNPGVYPDMWLLPSRLVGQVGSDNTNFEPSGEVCYLGPIICTVTIASDGSVESIVPTMKNGGYFDGEELILIHSRVPEIGRGDKYIRVNLQTGSDSGLSYMGNAYWTPVGYLESATWSSSIYKRFHWGSARQNAFEDVRCHSTIVCQYERTIGSTTWYWRNYYSPTGWSSTRGRCDLLGTYEQPLSLAIDLPTYTDGTYQYRCYRNTTPGSECMYFGGGYYAQNGPGIYKMDTSDHYIGSDYFSDYALQSGTAVCPWSTTYNTSDATMGYESSSSSFLVPTMANYLKPWRTMESDNFLVAGGNENLAICSSNTVTYSPIYSSDYTVAFAKFTTNIAGRVAAS